MNRVIVLIKILCSAVSLAIGMLFVSCQKEDKEPVDVEKIAEDTCDCCIPLCDFRGEYRGRCFYTEYVDFIDTNSQDRDTTYEIEYSLQITSRGNYIVPEDLDAHAFDDSRNTYPGHYFHDSLTNEVVIFWPGGKTKSISRFSEGADGLMMNYTLDKEFLDFFTRGYYHYQCDSLFKVE